MTFWGLGAGRLPVALAACVVATAAPCLSDAELAAAASALVAGDAPALERLAQSLSGADLEPLRYAQGAALARNLGAPDSSPARREAYVAHMQSRAAATKGWWRQQYLLALSADAPYRIQILDKENRFNKFSNVFNRAVSSVTRLAFLQPGEAVSMVIDAARGGLANRDATIRERLMAAEARKFLVVHPGAAEAPAMGQFLSELDTRLEADRARWYQERGLEAASRGALDIAGEYLALSPANATTSGARERLARAMAERDEIAERLVVAGGGDTGRPAAYLTAIETLSRDLSAGRRIADAPTEQNTAAGTAARLYAQAALQAREGRLESAVDLLVAVKDGHPKSPEAPAAQVAVDNPHWNLEAGWNQAVADLDQRRKRYMVTGGRSAQDTALSGASAVAQAGAGAGALFGTDFLFRSVAEGFRSRVDSDRAQDAAARYLRRLPEGRIAPQLKRARVDLEKASGNSGAALELLTAPDAPPPATGREVARLRERQARDRLVAALAEGDLRARREALESLATELGDTPSGKKAAERLAAMPGGGQAAASAVVVPRDILRANPDAAAQLGVPADWIDGLRRNGELTAEGVVLSADGRSASMRISTREQWRVQELGANGANRRLALASELALVAAGEKEGAGLLARRRLPLGVEGGAGGGGVDVAPRLLPYEDRPGTERLFGR